MQKLIRKNVRSVEIGLGIRKLRVSHAINVI